MISVKKKRYYYVEKGKIKGKGGVQTRSDVLQLAKDLQKELLEDIFFKKFDKERWKNKLLVLKEKINNFELEEKHIIKISGLGKAIGEYGKAMIDGETGLQKLTKDGKPRFAPIPANVQIAKRLIEEGDNIDVGDKIKYVVVSTKPKIQPITVKEYRANKRYDVNYYYTAVIKAILEILMVTHKEDVYTYFKECWLFTPRQLISLQKKLEDDDDE
jgi:DNA polymerase elongation subunit (family B)